MRLRNKLVLLLSALIAVFTAATWGIQRGVIQPGFDELEADNAERDAARVREAIVNEISHLDSFCFDWAAWDDTYQFVQDANEPYREANLDAEIFTTGNFTLLYYFDDAGRLVWGENRDPDHEYETLELEALPARDWPLDHPLLTNRELTRGIHGLYMTEVGPFLISTRPILTSAKEGPLRGWLVMGRKLDDTLLARLVEQTHVEFVARAIDAEGLSESERAAAREVVASDSIVLQHDDEHWLTVHQRIDDFSGAPALMISARLPREVAARASAVLDFALISSLVVSVLLLAALLCAIQVLVVSPVTELTGHAVALGKNDDLNARIGLDRADEIGVLASEFDAMVAKLAASRVALVESARRGGMSEVATNVLHNVGNMLNSVNVSSVVVSEKLASPSVRDLERAIELMTQHHDDLGEFITHDARGKHLPEFLRGAVANLSAERELLAGESRNLQEGIGHIRALVDAQQDLARHSGVAENVLLEEQFDAALKMVSAGTDLAGIRVVREFAKLEPLAVEKHKLLQILVNLIRNAAQSVRAHGGEACITLATSLRGERVQLSVRDTGVGIAADNLARVFQHGFTTKRDGHGFGLHSCANAAAELGGSLTAASDGLGRGATFVLELPVLSPARPS